jgi:hypothetical protein
MAYTEDTRPRQWARESPCERRERESVFITCFKSTPGVRHRRARARPRARLGWAPADPARRAGAREGRDGTGDDPQRRRAAHRIRLRGRRRPRYQHLRGRGEPRRTRAGKAAACLMTMATTFSGLMPICGPRALAPTCRSDRRADGWRHLHIVRPGARRLSGDLRNLEWHFEMKRARAQPPPARLAALPVARAGAVTVTGNWRLGTGTKPGARHAHVPSRSIGRPSARTRSRVG